MSRQFFYLLIAVSVFIISCKHSPGDLPLDNGGGGAGTGGTSAAPCDPTKIYFQQQVLPILISNCAMSGCHDDVTRNEGVVLTSYQKVMATGDITPGNAGGSKLYKVIVETDPGDRMPPPPQNSLTAQQVQIIYSWIQQGAKDLVCASMCDSTVFTYRAAIQPIIQNKCQGCHSGTNAQGSIDLSTYTLLKAKVADGKLWGSINHQTGYSPMPKNGTKLSECELSQFQKWINAGAPNN
ncbi:MAG TPA: c-type cytochrome domain-containing protein [Chitinophagaceae bacterium]|nr:c-type cytochrome domain-containing protein [Chitinophagaceae bacterium]